MLPQSLVLLVCAMCTPIVYAETKVATCAANSKTVPLIDVTQGIARVCGKITAQKSPYFAGIADTISKNVILDFRFGNADSPECRGANADTNNCRAQFESIMHACDAKNATFSGNGTIDTGCGIYNIASLMAGQTGKMNINPQGGQSSKTSSTSTTSQSSFSTSTTSTSSADNTTLSVSRPPINDSTQNNDQVQGYDQVQGSGAHIVMASGTLLFGLGCIMTFFL